MKLLKITTLYPGCLKILYESFAGLRHRSYTDQEAALYQGAYGWADFWAIPMKTLGYELRSHIVNAGPLQRAWAEENGMERNASADLKEIAVEQARRFRPDILWYDDTDENLLRRILFAAPSIRLVLGWVGSAIPQSDVFSHMDLVLSCAPESVAAMEAAGHPSAHLHHGFDPRIPGNLSPGPKTIDVSFIGQVVRSGGVHQRREELLEKIADRTSLEIFSPSEGFTLRDDARATMKGIIYHGAHALLRAGIPEACLDAIPLLGKARRWHAEPVLPVNRGLKRFLKPAVFGLEMFQVIRDSRITLNIHADSSPRFASNMRLFETTGVGTCLVTDWKENLHELFVPEEEVVTYRSADECVEKVRWLLAHPREREEIAAAGMRRTLREHTFEQRAPELDHIIRSLLARGRRGRTGAS